MDRAGTQSPGAPGEPDGRPICELVVLNGRLSGARMSLGAPLTLLGQAAGCDVRLNAEGVCSLHCAIAIGRETVTVRDLGGEGITWVNGEAIVSHDFRHGDLLTVGPFHFRIELNLFKLGGEREALRVQAAAVAAQQAALTEEEIRLQRRFVALEQQEQQLATHLEDRSRDVDVLQQQMEERGQALTACQKELEEERAALGHEREGVAAERLRLAKLWDRFKRNWKRSRREREVEMARKGQAVADERQRLEEMRVGLQHDRTVFQQSRLRANGEIELARRQLQHGWEELGAAQREWEEGHEREEADLEQRRNAVECWESKLAIVEGALLRDREHWTRTREALIRESEGLDARIGNLRVQAAEWEDHRAAMRELVTAEVAVAETAPNEKPAGAIPIQAFMVDLVSHLVDQRRCLLENWEQLLLAHCGWSEERHRAQTDLETTYQRLEDQSGVLDAKRRDVEVGRMALQQGEESVAKQRVQLSAWQASLGMREAAWTSERAGIVACAAHRETIAEAMKQDLELLREKWFESRRRELERLRAARMGQASLRRHYTELWQACQQEKANLSQERRKLATKSLALECWRQELLPRFANSPAAERRLEKYIEHEVSLQAEAEAELDRQHELLQIERGRLEERARGLDQDESTIAAREDELAHRLTEFELRQAALVDEHRRLQAELESVRCLRTQDQRQISDLRDEVERLIQALLEGIVAVVSQPGQAA